MFLHLSCSKFMSASNNFEYIIISYRKKLFQSIDRSTKKKKKDVRANNAMLQHFNKQKLLPFVKLILKFPSPDRLSTSAISQRISSLNHETFNDPVKNEIIVILIPAVCCKVLHSFRTFFWIKFHMNVTHCRMQNLVKQMDNKKKYE